jgi:hypothetical protein
LAEITKAEDVNETLRLSMAKYFKKNSINTASAGQNMFLSCAEMDNSTFTTTFELNDSESINPCSTVFGSFKNIAEKGAEKSEVIHKLFPNLPLSQNYPTEEQAKMEMVEFDVDTVNGSKRIEMHKAVKTEIQAAFTEIAQKGFIMIPGQSFKYRVANGGGGDVKMSNHSLGVAIDVNPGKAGNPFFEVSDKNPIRTTEEGIPQNGPWPWSFKVGNDNTYIATYNGKYDNKKCFWHKNHEVVQIMTKHGFGWGGWYGDTMHFSIFNGR